MNKQIRIHKDNYYKYLILDFSNTWLFLLLWLMAVYYIASKLSIVVCRARCLKERRKKNFPNNAHNVDKNATRADEQDMYEQNYEVCIKVANICHKGNSWRNPKVYLNISIWKNLFDNTLEKSSNKHSFLSK